MLFNVIWDGLLACVEVEYSQTNHAVTLNSWLEKTPHRTTRPAGLSTHTPRACGLSRSTACTSTSWACSPSSCSSARWISLSSGFWQTGSSQDTAQCGSYRWVHSVMWFLKFRISGPPRPGRLPQGSFYIYFLLLYFSSSSLSRRRRRRNNKINNRNMYKRRGPGARLRTVVTLFRFCFRTRKWSPLQVLHRLLLPPNEEIITPESFSTGL